MIYDRLAKLFLLSNGRQFTSLEPYGLTPVASPVFSLDERAEIAVYMILAWQRWLETGSPYEKTEPDRRIRAHSFTEAGLREHLLTFDFVENAVVTEQPLGEQPLGEGGHYRVNVTVSIRDGFNVAGALTVLRAWIRDVVPLGVTVVLNPLQRAHPDGPQND